MGTLLSSMVLGSILGSLGELFVPHQWQWLSVIIVAIIGIGMAFCDLGVGSIGTLTLRRQTCPVWWRTLGQFWAVFLWGLDLGLGFTTIRVASLYWIVFLMAFVLASPLTSASILGAYGLALALNLGVGIFLRSCQYPEAVFAIRVLHFFFPVRKRLALVLLLWSLGLIIAVLANF